MSESEDKKIDVRIEITKEDLIEYSIDQEITKREKQIRLLREECAALGARRVNLRRAVLKSATHLAEKELQRIVPEEIIAGIDLFGMSLSIVASQVVFDPDVHTVEYNPELRLDNYGKVFSFVSQNVDPTDELYEAQRAVDALDRKLEAKQRERDTISIDRKLLYREFHQQIVGKALKGLNGQVSKLLGDGKENKVAE